ncbi:MAG TPA: FAD-dependent oxidoreductase [Candidatus Dormibacteraeota bacterium]|nr:FAD-dependent oxidoreductase [Candidatus Dormibacteraeota bacterium]
MAIAPRSCDALVIGAGAGGLCAAALLARGGHRTLLVESRDRVGGRASTVEEDGFLVNTGAIAIEPGGALEEVFRRVDAPFEIRVPNPCTVFRLRGRDVDLSRGGWGRLVNGLTRRGAGVLSDMGRARGGEMPDERLTVREWLDGYTSNRTLHAIFRNLCAAIFAVNAEEMPARAFLTYFIRKGAFRTFGFSPTGTLGLMRGLATAVERDGGEVWLGSSVRALRVEDGRVRSATVERDGALVEVECAAVVSNAGPAATVALCGRSHLSAGYLERMDRDLRSTANIVVNIASREPLMKAPGIVTFGRTRRLCNMANLTATCPELAPPGWHLYVAYGVPVPAAGDFDEEQEVALTLEDLREQLRGFDRARVLSVRVMRGEWPAQRSIAGLDLPRETSLANLWNVGDGVREYASGGVQACAETALLVVEAISAAGAAAASGTGGLVEAEHR